MGSMTGPRRLQVKTGPAPMADVDVLVVGAGPTGLTLAGELLRFGLSVRVIDRAVTPPLDQSRALVIHARTLELFDQVGIADKAQALGTHVTVRTAALLIWSVRCCWLLVCITAS